MRLHGCYAELVFQSVILSSDPQTTLGARINVLIKIDTHLCYLLETETSNISYDVIHGKSLYFFHYEDGITVLLLCVLMVML